MLETARLHALRAGMSRGAIAALLVLVVATELHSPAASAQGFPYPYPRPLPCAGPNVVPAATQALAERVAAATRAIEGRGTGAWRALRDLAEAACTAGDRSALDAIFERCIRKCADEGDRYLARIDYARTLERFGAAAAAEEQYVAAIAMRPGRPPEAIEAYNSYALLLAQQRRPQEALAVLNRFDADELRRYAFAGWLKLGVMRELGMDTRDEAAAILGPLFSSGPGAPLRPFMAARGATPDERPLAEPIAVEVLGEVTIESRGGPQHTEQEKGHLRFNRMGTSNPALMQNPALLAQGIKLSKGDEFIVLATLGGDACRIEHAGATYDVTLCPWLRESGDRERDLYRVLGKRASARVVAATPVPRLPSLPFEPPVVMIGPPDDPMLWRNFYYNIEFIGHSSPGSELETLRGRAGLTLDDARIVLELGHEYLEQFAKIDEDARAEIAARFQAPLPFNPAALFPPATGGGATPRVLVPGRTPDGRSVQEVLASEGFMGRIDEQKEGLLRAHVQRLDDALGPAKRAALERSVHGAGSGSFSVPVQAPPPAVGVPRPPQPTTAPLTIGVAHSPPTSSAPPSSDAEIVRRLAPEIGDAELDAPGALADAFGPSPVPPGLGFRFERDLNADGQPDLVLLGRYMLGGSKQTFALIATRKNGPWQRVALLQFERDFIVGELSETRPNELRVFFCHHCDFGGTIEWTGSAYGFRQF